MLSPKWRICTTAHPPEARGHLGREEGRECKSQRWSMTIRTLSYGHSGTAIQISKHQLGQHAQNLHKVKKDQIPAGEGRLS